ncbi:MAG: XdhC family protein [Acidimicrobiia bacterium]
MSEVLATLRAVIDEERLGALATVVSGDGVGASAVVDFEQGLVVGKLPHDILEDVVADSRVLMEQEKSRTLSYGDREVFIETLAPPPRLIIVGAVHVAEPLSQMAALVGFRVTVVDARSAFTTRERFPLAHEVLVGWPHELYDQLDVDRRTYVVILSHDARFEDPLLPLLLKSPVRYIGAMGSRRTHAKRTERLRSTGWDEEAIERIFGPVGLDIGAESPEEIAVSILAEMVQVRYGSGTGKPLRGRSGRIHLQRVDDPGDD